MSAVSISIHFFLPRNLNLSAETSATQHPKQTIPEPAARSNNPDVIIGNATNVLNGFISAPMSNNTSYNKTASD